MLAVLCLAALGSWAGLWLYRTLLPEAVAVLLASGGVLLALLQFGAGRIDDHLRSAIDVLRSVPSPRTDRLVEYAVRKRRRQTRARLAAAGLAVGALAAAALLRTDALKALKPELAVNQQIAVGLAVVGTAFLVLQALATAVALRLWLDAERFEADAHQLARAERDRLAFQREAAKAGPPRPIRALSDPMPIRYAGSVG